MRSARVVVAMLVMGACGRFGFDATATSDSCTPGPCAPVPMDAPDLFDAPRGMAGVDSDGDGVFDDADNCIMAANASQHDEDADGYGDSCDNCPTLANTSQANSRETAAGATADTVGDACDPRPTQGGESILYFETFAGSALTTDWSVINGTWSVAADALAQPTITNDQRIHELAGVTGGDYVVETTFTFTGFDSANVNGGIVFRMQNNNGWLCGVFRDDTATPVVSLLMIWTLQNGAANFERNSATISEPTIGARYRILAGGYGSNQYCALDSFQTGTTAPFTSNKGLTGVPGLRTNYVAGTYSYFLVYGLGGPI